MKTIIFLLLPLFTLAQVNSRHVVVNGGYQNGGYVRTAPNSTINDNFSTVGNTNPYTGEAGTVYRDNSGDRYSVPEYNFGLIPNTSPVIAREIPSSIGDGEIPLANDVHYKEAKLPSQEEKIDLSKPMTGSATESSLWEIETNPKPSFRRYNTDIDSKYDLQSDGTYKKKGSSDSSIVFYILIGTCLLGIFSLIFKSKA